MKTIIHTGRVELLKPKIELIETTIKLIPKKGNIMNIVKSARLRLLKSQYNFFKNFHIFKK